MTATHPDGYRSPTRIERLALTDFRNYRSAVIEPGADLVVLTGDNGAGKTNLLEAISLLSPGRGLRRATLDRLAREDSAGFAIHARLETPAGDCEIGTGTLGAEVGETARRIRINSAPARSADELLDWLRVIWLVPAMDQLFTGPAADRRRFIDRLVLAIDPDHGRRTLDFEKAMRGRNRLLAEDSRDGGWFEAIEAQMAETGIAIAAARAELVRLLAAMIERMPDDGPFPKADIVLAGSIEEELGRAAAVDLEDAYRRRLAEMRGRDRAAQRTLEGPHRSDLLVTHRPKKMAAELCSTGEQKALLTGLILAHARLVTDTAGVAPILLLDEIAAHLDAGRRAALFAILDDLRCQTFMTGTDAALFSALQGRAGFFTVAGGSVTPTS